MTLVVARKDDGKIHVIGDTLVTRINGEKLPYEKCIVKTVLINVQCCVCFSGNVDAANRAIAHLIDKNYSDVNKILSYLEGIHNKHNQSVDFGVITNIDGDLALHSLKSGEALNNINQFWLGENYNEFQEAFGSLDEEAPLKNKMQNAMLTLIQDGNLNSIGGFDLSISTANELFQFEDSNGKRVISAFTYDFGVHHTIASPQTISFKEKGEYKPIEGGTNDSISVFSSTNPYLPGVGLHYKHANIGYLFCPHLRINIGQPELALEPFIFVDTEPLQFIERASKDHGVDLRGFIVGNTGTLTYRDQANA